MVDDLVGDGDGAGWPRRRRRRRGKDVARAEDGAADHDIAGGGEERNLGF
jgi:hypothetical protein